MKNGCRFVNMRCMEKIQITDPPKVWISGFLSVNKNGISALAIMKKLKNGHYFINMCYSEKISNYQSPQNLGL